MQEIDYHAPTSLDDAVAMLATLQDARIIAGGTDLIAQMRERRRRVRHVIDVKRVAELGVIEMLVDGGWRIGAAVPVRALERDARLGGAHPGLIAASRLIGSVQIQSRASVGGNICNAAPSADAVPILVALGAEAEVAGPAGRRRLPVAGVAIGPGLSCLGPGEILVAVTLPAVAARSYAVYERFTPRREMDIAVAGVAAHVSLDADGAVTTARIALASVAPTVIVAEAASAMLVGHRLDTALMAATAACAAGESRPITDARASADYRRTLVAVLTRRVLGACAARIGASP